MIVVNKGYTLTCVSWENDGDNYRTKSIVIQDKNEAIRIGKMCLELFSSCNNGGKGIGNTNEGYEYKAESTILNYLGVDEDTISDDEKEQLIYDVMKINNELMDGSEWYYSRVCESVKITYSPIDIEVEEINF